MKGFLKSDEGNREGKSGKFGVLALVSNFFLTCMRFLQRGTIVRESSPFWPAGN